MIADRYSRAAVHALYVDGCAVVVRREAIFGMRSEDAGSAESDSAQE